MIPRLPDQQGLIERDGVKIAYDLYENDGPTILLMPTWSIVHSRHWKAQIPYLARHFRVLTFDGRGNGRSDRLLDPTAYSDYQFVDDAVSVLDASQTDRAIVAGVSMGAHWAALLAGLHPARVKGVIAIGASTSLPHYHVPERTVYEFEGHLETDEGWAKYNADYWRRNYREFCEFFFGEIFSEPHSTKQIEDAVCWSQETDAETLIATEFGYFTEEEEERAIVSSIKCPVLVIHGTEDRIAHHSAGEAIARLTGASLVLIEGGGHFPQARDPVVVNRAFKDFVDRIANKVAA